MKRSALAVALAFLASAAPAARPVIAVLPVEGGGKQEYGKFVRNSLHQKLARSFQFLVLEPPDVDRAMAVAGFRITRRTTPAEVARFARHALRADRVVWGFARRASARMGWLFTFHFMDLEKSDSRLQWTVEKKVTKYRELPLLCVDVVVKLTGFRKRIGMEPIVPAAGRIRNAPNLLPNGDFEQGKEWPAKWERINNLTTFWGTAGITGRCLTVNTDVLAEQVYAWQKRLLAGANFRKPPKRLPTRPPKYNTIAGAHGVHYHSDPIPAKRGMVYRITVYVKGPSKPKIFVKGYAHYGAGRFAAQDREVYRMYLSCESLTNGRQWEKHTRTFLPNAYYVILGVENTAKTAHAVKTVEFLRRRMRARDFPVMPEVHKKEILDKTRYEINYDATVPELVVYIRDRLLCGHGVYGRVFKSDKGLRLGLRLVSARIKRNVPLVDLTFPISDDASLIRACDLFLAECEKRMPFTQHIRVIPYSYWRPGAYRYDNITLVEEGRSLW